nr:hypothetical protein [Tanacetum cinerariifolium]
MTSITAQQTKLDLELVPEENRSKLFWMHLHSLHAILHLSSLLMSLKYTCTSFRTLFTSITTSTDLNLTKRKDSNLLWKSSEISFKFALELRIKTLIPFPLKNTLSLSGKTTAFDKLRLSRAHILWGMYYQKNESKAYKTYLGYATGTVPPKVARKFKKVSSSKKDSVPVAADEEPVQKDKRVKTSVKKSLTALTTCFVIREPHVETR